MIRGGVLVGWFLLLLSLSALVLAFYFPLGAVLLKALRAGASAEVYDTYFIKVIEFTYGQALLCASLAGVFGLVGAWTAASGSGALWRFSMALGTLPFSLPPVIVVLGLLGVWGKRGLFAVLLSEWGIEWQGIYGWTGIVIAHVFFNFPIFVRLVGQSLSSQDAELEKVALSLGLSRWRCFWQVTWPKVRSAFWSAWILAFLYCSTSFLIVLVLGGGPAFSTIEVAVFRALKLDQDLWFAASLGAIQFVVGCLALCLLSRFHTRVPSTSFLSGPGYFLYRSRWQGSISLFYFCALFFLVGLPLLWICYKGMFAILPLHQWFADVGRSLFQAVSAGALATAVALSWELAGRLTGFTPIRSLGSLMCTLPVALSSLLVLLGWRILYLDWFSDGDAYWFAIVVVQAVVALPVVARCVREGFGRLSEQQRRAASSLGASWWMQVWWVDLPSVRSDLVMACLLGVVIALGEAGAVLLFNSDTTANLTFRVYQNMSHYRFEQAYGAALALLITTAMVLGATSFFEKKGAT